MTTKRHNISCKTTAKTQNNHKDSSDYKETQNDNKGIQNIYRDPKQPQT